jgi:hypothetical protein
MHDDLLTVLDDDRINEEKYRYPYPEHEENTKTIKKLEEVKEDEEKIAEKIEDTEDKKSKKIIIILGIIFTGILLILIVVALVIPKLTVTKAIEVPDVKNMTVSKAEKTLQDKGFEVNTKIKNSKDKGRAGLSLAIAYLNDYLPWYKVKFKAKGGGYIQESIILELKSHFGNNVDVKVIKNYLAKSGIISSSQIFCICVLVFPLLASAIFYNFVQLEQASIYFIFCIAFLVIGVIFAGI